MQLLKKGIAPWLLDKKIHKGDLFAFSWYASDIHLGNVGKNVGSISERSLFHENGLTISCVWPRYEGRVLMDTTTLLPG